VLLPLILLLLATLAATIVAYGTHPTFAQFSHGLALILFSRQYQWPLATLSILLCLAVIALVVSGKRRAWWLIGLAPVTALFIHRFYSDPLHAYSVADADNRSTISANQASYLNDDDYIVGLNFNGTNYAYPYFALYRQPVIIQSDHDKRMILLWSAFANRAQAFNVTRDLHARDLEIVSMPANALLIYNRKLGQFINGLTGQTPANSKPTDFGQPIPTQKLHWKIWLTAHPDTRVMLPTASAAIDRTPNLPLRPWFPQPNTSPPAPDTQIKLAPTTQPIAFTNPISTNPLNLSGPTPLLIFRPTTTAPPKAFDRRLNDLTLTFHPNTNPRRPRALFIDSDTNSGWTVDGKAIDGPLANQKLIPIPLEEDLYWGPMKHWLPTLTLATESK
jgi:hypothetical protein